MNFTFGTFLVVLFLVPGFLYRKGYFTKPFSYKYAKHSLLSEIAWVTIPSVFFNILGLTVARHMSMEFYSNLKSTFMFIFEGLKSNPDYKSFSCEPTCFVIYFSCLSIFAYFIGYLICLLIRILNIDKRNNLFEFQNEWYYFFSGEILDFKDVHGDSRDIDLVLVDALVYTGSKNVLYKGICTKYALDENGGLSTITLQGAMRKVFNDNNYSTLEKQKEKSAEVLKLEGEQVQEQNKNHALDGFKEINSHLLVLKASNIININFWYYKDKNSKEKRRNIISEFDNILLLSTLLIIVVLFFSFNTKKTEEEKQEQSENLIVIGFFIIATIIVFLFVGKLLISSLFAFGCSALIYGLVKHKSK